MIKPGFITNKLAMLSIIAVVVVCAVCALVTYPTFRSNDQRLREELLVLARTAAGAVDTELLSGLSGTETDLINPKYQKIKQQLATMRAGNPKCRFIYLMGLHEDGSVYFFMDSEPAESADNSPPGQIYTEAAPAIYQVFATGQATVDGPATDRWGTWVSAYSPLVDPGKEKLVAVLGMDIDSKDWWKLVAMRSAMPALFTLLLVILVVFFFALFQATLKIKQRMTGHEEELLRAKAAAEAANRAKDDFLANTSHELRTPLHAIMGTAKLLEQTRLDQEQQDFLVTLNAATDYLLLLVNDLLDFSRIEAGKMELVVVPLGMRHLLTEIERNVAAQARARGLSLECRVAENVPATLYGDAKRLQQILWNLVSNAVKFTDTGSIGVYIDMVMEDEAEVVVRFVVRDTGIGIPPDELKYIFEKFHRAHKGKDDVSRSGTGLGLAITRQLVELMGGQLEVTSTVGQGSEFVFTAVLRRTRLESTARETTHLASVPAGRDDFNILLVDDLDMNRFVIGSQIRKLWPKARVDIAVNGQEALDLIRVKTYDFVLMDIQMPVLDGFGAVAAIRKLAPPACHVPVLAVSAGVTAPEETQRAGFDDYLFKPFRIEELQAKVHALLRSPPRH